MRLFERIKHHFVPSEANAYRPHILHRPWLIFFFTVILVTEGFLVSNLIARQSSQNFLAAVVPAEIIALTNTERAENNAGVVTEDALLERAAQAKAEDMAAKGYFSHTGPDGKTPWQWIAGSGYKYQYAGENLAVRFIDSSEVVNAWMESPTHRANIVKSVYTKIGVGVAQGMYEGQSATFVVQYFASPAGVDAARAAPIASGNAVPATLAADTTNTAPVATAQTPTATTPTPAASAPVAVATAPAVPQTPVVQTNTPASGQVEGAAVTAAAAPATSGGATVAAHTLNSYTQSFIRYIARALAEPKAVTNWILGLCASILIIAIFLTFFMHMHVQPTQMLMGSAFVALFALSLVGLNSRLGAGGGPGLPGQAGNLNASLAASPAEAVGYTGVVIGEEAASTGYALFSQQ